MAGNWPLTPLGDVTQLLTGYPFTSAMYVEHPDAPRLLRGDNIAQGVLRWGGAKRWPQELTDHVQSYWLRKDDVVIAMDRPWIEAGLKFASVRESDTPALLVQRVARLRGSERLQSRFLRYLIASRSFSEYVLAIQTGTAVPHISAQQIKEFEVALPPLAEQHAIADVLGALDDKIEQNRRSARVLEELARAVFCAWFVDFEPVKAKAAGAASFLSMPQSIFDALPTRFVDSDIGPVPEGWKVKTIGDVVTTKGGGTPSTKNPEYWDGGEHCWATPKDMSRLSHPVLLNTERRITEAAVNSISSGMLPVGTVLMSSRAPVGYLGIARVPTAINQGFIAMVCDGPLPPIYVLNWALTSMDAIKARASGTTFPEISKKNFRPLPVVLPTSNVIAAYQQTSDPIFELIAACVKENLQLTQMRDYLLPLLLSGTVRMCP